MTWMYLHLLIISSPRTKFSRVLNLTSLPYIYFKRATFHFQPGWEKNVNEGTHSSIQLLENLKNVLEEVSCVLT